MSPPSMFITSNMDESELIVIVVIRRRASASDIPAGTLSRTYMSVAPTAITTRPRPALMYPPFCSSPHPLGRSTRTAIGPPVHAPSGGSGACATAGEARAIRTRESTERLRSLIGRLNQYGYGDRLRSKDDHGRTGASCGGRLEVRSGSWARARPAARRSGSLYEQRVVPPG